MVKKSLRVDSDSSSYSSSSEEEILQPHSSPPTTTPMKSTADSGSDSEDFDRPLNTIVSKHSDDGSKLKKPRSRPNSKPNLSPSPMTTPVKRPSASKADKDPKKAKTVKAQGEEEGKKSVLFERKWSEDDEVAVLKGMLDYKEQKGSDPMNDPTNFLEFIKSSVHFNVDQKQVVGKVKRLKKRFKNLKEKKKFNPHETVLVELCNKIWGQKVESSPIATTSKVSKNTATTKSAGNAIVGASAPVQNGSCPTQMKMDEEDKTLNFLGKATIAMGLDEAIVAAGLGLCGEDRKSELEKKWRKLYAVESDLFLKKLDLAREESEMITEALRGL